MSSSSQASQRINALLDENSFVEIGALVTARSTDFNLKQEETPSDGVVTGYGVIDGNLVYVYSQDSSVLGGSIGEMHAKKIVRLYDLAIKTGSPVIGLIDSAGLRLQEGSDALNAFGEIYLKQVEASGVVPQITAVFGTCGGGLALIPSITDFTFMESDKAKMFVNSPNVLDGNYKEKLDTSSAKWQSENAGNVDVVADEAAIYAQIRELVSLLPSNNEDGDSYDECSDDLNRACENLDGYTADPALIAGQIADNGVFFETKRDYAKEMLQDSLSSTVQLLVLSETVQLSLMRMVRKQRSLMTSLQLMHATRQLSSLTSVMLLISLFLHLQMLQASAQPSVTRSMLPRLQVSLFMLLQMQQYLRLTL